MRHSAPSKATASRLALLALCLLPSVAGAAIHAIADRYVVPVNAPALDLRPLANDGVPAAELAGGSLAIVRAPRSGQAVVRDAGTVATAADDVVRYTPNADASGEDGFRYRVCGGGVCEEAEVAVVLRPVAAQVDIAAAPSGGYRDLALSGLPALPAARFTATRLVSPAVEEHALEVDPSPWRPFAGNAALSLHVLPSTAQAREWRVLVDAASLSGGDVDVYLGIDLDRNGEASADELRCAAAMSTVAERCDMALTVPACGNLAYWMLLVNAGSAPHTARAQVYEVPMDPGEGVLSATGPGMLAAGTAGSLRLAWAASRLAPGDAALGFVEVSPDGSRSLGAFPVRLVRGAEDVGLPLADGDRPVRLGPGRRADRAFIDVPAGATSLVATARADGPIDVYLARTPAPSASAAIPVVASAPPRSAAAAAAASPSADQRLVLSGAALAPGRWFLVVSNPSPTDPVDIHLRAVVAGTAPEVRPGGYYNTGRPGHGLFLYPAGTQWAGLWYTYFQDATPTWYYLQGAAPGGNGLWRGTIYRSSWDGTRNRLVAVGEAGVSPTARDAFTFTYRIDGQVGSEPFVALGRGCPSLAGEPVDASSHWYNAARAGAGYSLQFLPNYEFHAVFAYDGSGMPRFLLAETPSFRGTAASMAIQQLRGTCPLCAWTAPPTRTTVGTLSRSLVSNRLSTVSVSATFASPLAGAWNVADTVQPLGGGTSLQGCAP